MEARTVRLTATLIQKRFFQAIDMLIDSGEILGLKTFCTKYDLHRSKYSKLRGLSNNGDDADGYKFIDIDALSYLTKDYGVSADWLLTGRGKMFDRVGESERKKEAPKYLQAYSIKNRMIGKRVK